MNITKEEGKQILGVLEKFRWEYGWTSNDDASYLFLQSKLSEPAHDDTALIRMALEALKELWDNFGVVCPSADLIDQYEAAITALRERLGEKV